MRNDHIQFMRLLSEAENCEQHNNAYSSISYNASSIHSCDASSYHTQDHRKAIPGPSSHWQASSPLPVHEEQLIPHDRRRGTPATQTALPTAMIHWRQETLQLPSKNPG